MLAHLSQTAVACTGEWRTTQAPWQAHHLFVNPHCRQLHIAILASLSSCSWARQELHANPGLDVWYLCLGIWPLVSETTQRPSLVNCKVTAVLQRVVCHPFRATLGISRGEGQCVTSHKKSTSCPYSRRRPIASCVESNVPINDHLAGSCFFVLVLGL
jgi:hypothetical protein